VVWVEAHPLDPRQAPVKICLIHQETSLRADSCCNEYRFRWLGKLLRAREFSDIPSSRRHRETTPTIRGAGVKL